LSKKIFWQDIHQWTNSTAPKILADVFEALIAAIFFDANNSLEILWKVIEPFLGQFMSMKIYVQKKKILFWGFLDRSIIDPKLNPIRSFSDKGGKIIT